MDGMGDERDYCITCVIFREKIIRHYITHQHNHWAHSVAGKYTLPETNSSHLNMDVNLEYIGILVSF